MKTIEIRVRRFGSSFLKAIFMLLYLIFCSLLRKVAEKYIFQIFPSLPYLSGSFVK